MSSIKVRKNRVLGKKLREARRKAGLSQIALSKEASIQQRRLSKIETGDVGWIRTDTLEKLCAILKVTPNDLLGYS